MRARLQSSRRKVVNPSSAGRSCAHAALSNKVRERTLQRKVAGIGARHWVNWSVRLNDDHHAR